MVALSTELQNNLAVAAHLAHVSYDGQRDETERVVPRYRITLGGRRYRSNLLALIMPLAIPQQECYTYSAGEDGNYNCPAASQEDYC